METKPVEKSAKRGFGTGAGRAPGTPNAVTRLVKEAAILAAEAAGGKGGLVAYLTAVAKKDPRTFIPLLARLVPTEITGAEGGALKIVVENLAAPEPIDPTQF